MILLGNGRRVTVLTHHLAGRPELTLDALGRVAATLDPSDIEQHAADIPVLHPSGQVRRLRQTFAEIVALEGATPWWVMLGGALCHEEPYDSMAADTSATWRKATAEVEGGVRARLVSVFISSPGAVVPLHIDTQHNVLAQVAGTKELTMGQITEAEIEECITSGVRNLRARPEATETFVVRPGEGLYIPPFTPHSVVGLDGISISLSSMWTTTWSETECMARYWNARFRRMGLRPRAPCGGRILDRAKASAATLHGRTARRRRHREDR